MRAVVQRVLWARVRRVDVEPPEERAIGPGLVLLVGCRRDEDDGAAAWLAQRVLGLRVFADAAGALNRSVDEVGGALLVVPNFTVYGDTRKGRRPSFAAAAPAAAAEAGFDALVRELERGPVPVRTGWFRAAMHVELANDGPVTLVVESPDPQR